MPERIEVGSEIYLFRVPMAEDQAPSQARHCVISAHAGYLSLFSQPLGKFTVPQGVTLHFYNKPDTEFVATTPMQGLARHPLEVTGKPDPNRQGEPTRNGYHARLVAGDTAIDYFLSKFQGTSAGDDSSYDEIVGTLTALSGARQTALMSRGPADGAVQALYAHRADVATVRNRFWSPGISLHSMLKALTPRGYTDFHCFFCRSSMT